MLREWLKSTISFETYYFTSIEPTGTSVTLSVHECRFIVSFIYGFRSREAEPEKILLSLAKNKFTLTDIESYRSRDRMI